MKPRSTALDPIYARLFPAPPGKGELRRQRVLEAAIQVLAEKGLGQLSHESVGKKLGMRRSHVAYYFPTIDSIIECSAKYVAGTAQGVTVERVESADRPAAKLAAWVEGNFVWAREYPAHAAFMMHFYSLCTHVKTFRELHLRLRETGRVRVLALLRELEGRRPAEASRLAAAAELIQSLVTSNLVEHLTGGCRQPLEAVQKKTVRQALAVAASVGGLQGLVD
jgi:AcrR family transcriptional regulator